MAVSLLLVQSSRISKYFCAAISVTLQTSGSFCLTPACQSLTCTLPQDGKVRACNKHPNTVPKHPFSDSSLTLIREINFIQTILSSIIHFLFRLIFHFCQELQDCHIIDPPCCSHNLNVGVFYLLHNFPRYVNLNVFKAK